MSGQKSSSNENEEKIINIIKEACKLQNLKPGDWKKYGPNVNNNNNYKIQLYNKDKKEFTFNERAKIKSLLIYEMPNEYRKQVNIYININYNKFYRYGLQLVK